MCSTKSSIFEFSELKSSPCRQAANFAAPIEAETFRRRNEILFRALSSSRAEKLQYKNKLLLTPMLLSGLCEDH